MVGSDIELQTVTRKIGTRMITLHDIEYAIRLDIDKRATLREGVIAYVEIMEIAVQSFEQSTTPIEQSLGASFRKATERIRDLLDQTTGDLEPDFGP